MKRITFATAASRMLAVAILGLTACATPTEKSDAPELKDYTKTGQTTKCLTNHQIKETRILNSHQILFELYGRQFYLGEADHCLGMSKGLAIAYDASIDQFCTTTIIHLIDPGTPVPQRGSCGIDKFEKLTQNPKPN